MPFLDKLEARFGRFAIPGLVQFIAGLQLLTFIIFTLLQPEGKAAYMDFLTLDGTRVLHGQVWRLFTYIFIPGTLSLLWVIIGTLFLMWLGRGLEAAWGPFRLTLYFIGGMLAVAVGSMIFGYTATGLFLFQSLLLAFAMIYPNEEILLFFIIPVKIKWIAWLNVALTVLLVMGTPSAFWPVIFSHLNFLIAFGPAFIKERQHLAKVGQKRAAFEAGMNSGAAFFHQCTVCQKTEIDDPKLDFRVNADGDEICDDCRAKASISG
jgi:membrane associated rhomboid family serine protease